MDNNIVEMVASKVHDIWDEVVSITIENKSGVTWCIPIEEITVLTVTDLEKENNIMTELNSLVGKHVLTGVDYGMDGDRSTITFVLDGINYTALEDENDGYRSCLDSLTIDDRLVKNIFPACEVLCTMENGYNEILYFTDTTTNKEVLAIGTEAFDDYYPTYIARFTPENMAVNGIKENNIMVNLLEETKEKLKQHGKP